MIPPRKFMAQDGSSFARHSLALLSVFRLILHLNNNLISKSMNDDRKKGLMARENTPTILCLIFYKDVIWSDIMK